MKQLLELVKKDTYRWEVHPLLENLDNDFAIGGLIRRGSWLGSTELLSFANDLMDVTISLHHNEQTSTWAVRGNLINQFVLFNDNHWPKPLRNRYISVQKAFNDYYDNVLSCVDNLERCSLDLFGIYWDGSDFDTGQHFTMIGYDFVYGGNGYAINLPPRLAANLFRGELALAQFFLIMVFSDLYSKMVDRPIDGMTVYPLSSEWSQHLFRVTPQKFLECRSHDKTKLHVQDIESVSQRSDEIKYGSSRKTYHSVGNIYYLREYSRPVRLDVESFLESDDIEGAIKHLTRFANLHPGNMYCHYKLAYIYLWINQPAKAFVEFGKWADLHIDRGYFGGALSILSEMEELCPGDPRVSLRKADAFRCQGWVDSATEELMKAGKISIEKNYALGLELFRLRMVRLWWHRLPAIEHMTPHQMLRLDFSRDLGFYQRDDDPPSGEGTTSGEASDWDIDWNEFSTTLIIPIFDLRELAELKRKAECLEMSSQLEELIESLMTIADFYQNYKVERKSIDIFERLLNIDKQRAPFYLQKLAELHFRSGEEEEGFNKMGELYGYYEAVNLKNKANLVKKKIAEMKEKIEDWNLNGFKFLDEKPIHFRDCTLFFELKKEHFCQDGSSEKVSGHKHVTP
ncbi:MAG: hypothetical protein C0614_06480 [Desulfuromonas sp.]|nr:MAG: hypothetical protein C0614_06480 [Desulfuromonas sp.]